MKYLLTFLIACFTLDRAQAEDVDVFLKRAAAGNFTKEDFHDKFNGLLFVGDRTIQVDKDKIAGLVEAIQKAGLQTVVDSFTIVSQTESPLGDAKAALISVVTKVQTTQSAGGKTTKHDTLSHEVLIRLPDGKLQYLSSVSKQ